jgi:hypothetical protein
LVKNAVYQAVEILATWMIKPGMTALYVYAGTTPEMNDYRAVIFQRRGASMMQAMKSPSASPHHTPTAPKSNFTASITATGSPIIQ